MSESGRSIKLLCESDGFVCRFRKMLSERLITSMSCLFGLTLLYSGAASAVELELRWSLENLFEMPESAVHDIRRNVIYVSNVNAYAKDANGYISRVSADGERVELKWLTGFHSPTGMAVFGMCMYGTRVLQERQYNRGRSTGVGLGFYRIEKPATLGGPGRRAPTGLTLVIDGCRLSRVKPHGEHLATQIPLLAFDSPLRRGNLAVLKTFDDLVPPVPPNEGPRQRGQPCRHHPRRERTSLRHDRLRDELLRPGCGISHGRAVPGA